MDEKNPLDSTPQDKLPGNITPLQTTPIPTVASKPSIGVFKFGEPSTSISTSAISLNEKPKVVGGELRNLTLVQKQKDLERKAAEAEEMKKILEEAGIEIVRDDDGNITGFVSPPDLWLLKKEPFLEKMGAITLLIENFLKSKHLKQEDFEKANSIVDKISEIIDLESEDEIEAKIELLNNLFKELDDEIEKLRAKNVRLEEIEKNKEHLKNFVSRLSEQENIVKNDFIPSSTLDPTKKGDFNQRIYDLSTLIDSKKGSPTSQDILDIEKLSTELDSLIENTKTEIEAEKNSEEERLRKEKEEKEKTERESVSKSIPKVLEDFTASRLIAISVISKSGITSPEVDLAKKEFDDALQNLLANISAVNLDLLNEKLAKYAQVIDNFKSEIENQNFSESDIRRNWPPEVIVGEDRNKKQFFIEQPGKGRKEIDYKIYTQWLAQQKDFKDAFERYSKLIPAGNYDKKLRALCAEAIIAKNEAINEIISGDLAKIKEAIAKFTSAVAVSTEKVKEDKEGEKNKEAYDKSKKTFQDQFDNFVKLIEKNKENTASFTEEEKTLLSEIETRAKTKSTELKKLFYENKEVDSEELSSALEMFVQYQKKYAEIDNIHFTKNDTERIAAENKQKEQNEIKNKFEEVKLGFETRNNRAQLIIEELHSALEKDHIKREVEKVKTEKEKIENLIKESSVKKSDIESFIFKLDKLNDILDTYENKLIAISQNNNKNTAYYRSSEGSPRLHTSYRDANGNINPIPVAGLRQDLRSTVMTEENKNQKVLKLGEDVSQSKTVGEFTSEKKYVEEQKKLKEEGGLSTQGIEEIQEIKRHHEELADRDPIGYYRLYAHKEFVDRNDPLRLIVRHIIEKIKTEKLYERQVTMLDNEYKELNSKSSSVHNYSQTFSPRLLKKREEDTKYEKNKINDEKKRVEKMTDKEIEATFPLDKDGVSIKTIPLEDSTYTKGMAKPVDVSQATMADINASMEKKLKAVDYITSQRTQKFIDKYGSPRLWVFLLGPIGMLGAYGNLNNPANEDLEPKSVVEKVLKTPTQIETLENSLVTPNSKKILSELKETISNRNSGTLESLIKKNIYSIDETYSQTLLKSNAYELYFNNLKTSIAGETDSYGNNHREEIGGFIKGTEEIVMELKKYPKAVELKDFDLSKSPSITIEDYIRKILSGILAIS